MLLLSGRNCGSRQLEINNIPQMITLTFSGAVITEAIINVYNKIFNTRTVVNPNGCTAKGTFFVSSTPYLRCRNCTVWVTRSACFPSPTTLTRPVLD